MNLLQHLQNYKAWNKQEYKDVELIINYLSHEDNLYTRDNVHYHFTASPWIINKDNTKVLMVHHNIYNSWGWCGGHADGDKNLLHVAIKEGKEETGIETLIPYNEDILSVDILPVPFHYKHGKPIEVHQHINITYLCVGDEKDDLMHRPEENSGVMWIEKDHINDYVQEEIMKPVYDKLKKKTDMMYKKI